MSLPHETELRHIENKLYTRMLRNAGIGFLRSAVIGAVVGLALGALVATGIGAGLIPALPFIVVHGTGIAATLGIAAQWALGFASIAGGFGAVAGIQSTRDGRRYLEIDTLTRETSAHNAEDRPLAHAQEPTLAKPAAVTDQPSHSFQDRLAANPTHDVSHQR